MTVKEIVLKALRDGGYDGLWNPDAECGCSVDDLMPCCLEGASSCEPGYLQHHRQEDMESLGENEWGCECLAAGVECSCIGPEKLCPQKSQKEPNR